MAVSVPGILKERKYPFIFAFFLLLVFVSFLLVSDSKFSIPITTNLAQLHHIPFDPNRSSVPNVSSEHDTPSSFEKESPPASDAPVSSSVPSSSDSMNSPDSSDSKDSDVPSSPDPINPSVSNVPPDSNVPTSSDTSAVPVPNPPPDSSVPLSSDIRNPPVPNALPGGDISSSDNSAITNISSNENTAIVAPAAAAANDDQAVNVVWELCKGPVAVDYIPCLDNWPAIKKLKSRKHMEHRERHCPNPSLRCLVPLPQGYKIPVLWPKSRDMIWYNNVPHPKLVEYKKDQHWVVKRGDYFFFPGGGTQFSNGVNFYINSIEKTLPRIGWGKRTRVILDVGCGVASFGGALLDKNVLTISVAPKDEHEAQIQFALERGVPAILAVIGTQRLTFPDNSFDLIHCARCRVHWDGDGGKPLMEVNRILRPGGYFIWSATPVYKKDERHRNIWKSMVALTESLCWSTVKRIFFRSSHVGLVIYQKPTSSSCYQNRKENKPPLCDHSSRLNSSWYAPLDGCLVPFQGDSNQWPSPWPERLTSRPLRLPAEPDAEETFKQDTRHWSALVSEVYLGSLGINWSNVRNVMDMNAGYGGFAAALINQPLWVTNVVPIHEPDTLPVIFDRGLIGIYHDWCESFNTYPRTYDLLHSSFLFGNLTKRCDIIDVVIEMDRILRPNGYLLVQDNMEVLTKLNPILKSLHWSTNIHPDQFLIGKKGFWRPDSTS